MSHFEDFMKAEEEVQQDEEEEAADEAAKEEEPIIIPIKTITEPTVIQKVEEFNKKHDKEPEIYIPSNTKIMVVHELLTDRTIRDKKENMLSKIEEIVHNLIETLETMKKIKTSKKK